MGTKGVTSNASTGVKGLLLGLWTLYLSLEGMKTRFSVNFVYWLLENDWGKLVDRNVAQRRNKTHSVIFIGAD